MFLVPSCWLRCARIVACAAACWAGFASVAVQASEAAPSVEASVLNAPLPSVERSGVPGFALDVQPALTKAGCNMGACHGSFQGRGGMSLSLLGYDPAVDYDTLFKADRGRRVLVAAPEQSLLLLKATGQIPHGGGVRVTSDSAAYHILRDYIAAGCPAPAESDPQITSLTATPAATQLAVGQAVALRVEARFSDGSRRDVTPWALYDVRDAQRAKVSPRGRVTALAPGRAAVTVRYLGQVAAVPITIPYGSPGAPPFEPRNYIDEIVLAEWRRLGLKPAEECDDAEFLRRVHLDLIGTLPTVDEARAFLDSTDPRKRDALIDALLERPEFVDFWTLKWSDLLRVHRRYVGDKGLESFSGWVRQAVRENWPVDRIASELLTAQGNLFTSGPVAFYLIDPKPEELAETTSQLFLGVRLQCTRCHHHPMEVWGQDDYYGLAAFFTRLEVKENKDQGKFGGARVVRVTPAPHPQRKLPRAAEPRLFGMPVEVSDSDPRAALAAAITSPGNPYFARNFANRFWAALTGRGLVEPVDDLRATNPPSMPALLDALARDLAEGGFDSRRLMRTICQSRVYQRASRIRPEPGQDATFYTHRQPRRLPAEALLDAIDQATECREAFPGVPAGTRALALSDPSVKSYFLDTFGRPARNSGCDCARGATPDLTQALHLANGAAVNDKIIDDHSRVTRLVTADTPREAIVEELYLATLSRRPTAEERRAVDELLADYPSPKHGYQDLLWTLLNCSEFQFNH